MKNSGKIIGAVVIVLLLAGGGYYLYGTTGSDSSSGSLLTTNPTGTSSSGTIETRKTLQRLNRLQGIDINTDFFTSSAFTGLENFGITIQPQPVGRENPFEPTQTVIPATVSESADDVTDQSLQSASTDSGTTTTNQPATTSTSSSSSATAGGQ